MTRTPQLALALGMAWGAAAPACLATPAPSNTSTAPAAPEATDLQLKPVTVRADSPTARPAHSAHTQIDPQHLPHTQGADSLAQWLHDQPDVSVQMAAQRVTANSHRTGTQGIQIRGLQGNRVQMRIDGVRVPDAFEFGPMATGRGDHVGAQGLQSVAVVRGATSAHLGSDGLAGAVLFRTLSADDVLQPGHTQGGFTRLGHSGADRSWVKTLALARRSGPWQALVLGSTRQGHETANRGDHATLDEARTSANPVNHRSRYGLAKASLALNPAHTLEWTLETQRRQQHTRAYSAHSAPPVRWGGTLGLHTHDGVARDRVSLAHQWQNPALPTQQQARTLLYWQNAQHRQHAQQSLHTPQGAVALVRDNHYSARTLGLSSVVHKQLTGAWPQRLSFGAEASRSQLSALRGGNDAMPGEVLPQRPFPTTAHTQWGAFASSQLPLGRLSVTPSLRWDQYRLQPQHAAQHPSAAHTTRGSAMTHSVGAVWHLAPQWAPYAHWGTGFRAPAPEQLNNHFSNPQHGYISVGNPDLKAERARSMEWGVRGQHHAWRYSLSAFDNRYADFISREQVGGTGRPGDPMVFQHVNLTHARIRGTEARAHWSGRSGWHAQLGVAHAQGQSQTAGVRQALQTVNPLQTLLGVGYRTAAWGLHAHLAHSSAKRSADASPVRLGRGRTGPAFTPPAYRVLDVGWQWQPRRRLTLNAQLHNALNAKYWRWSDVRGVADASPVKDAYTAAGRSLNVSLRWNLGGA